MIRRFFAETFLLVPIHARIVGVEEFLPLVAAAFGATGAGILRKRATTGTGIRHLWLAVEILDEDFDSALYAMERRCDETTTLIGHEFMATLIASR